MSLVLRPLGLSLACLGLSFACATAQDDPFLQGTGGRIDTAGKGGGGATAGTAGQTGKGGATGKGGTGGSSGAPGKGGAGGTSGGGTGGTDGGAGDPGSSGADAGGMGGAPGPDPCAPEGTPPELHVLLQNGSSVATSDPTGDFRLVNGTDDDLPLSEMSFRYYFTSEFDCEDTLANTNVNITYFQLQNPFVEVGAAAITNSVVQLEERGRYCDVYFEIGFSDTAPALEPEQEAAIGLWTQVAIFTTAHDQTNDFSFGACTTKRVWWDRITVYRDGVRVSGTGPANDSGEGGAGGQGGQGGLGGAGGEAGDSGGQGGAGGSAGADAGGAGGEGGAPGEAGGAGESAGGASGGGAL
jgi:hypothetical protein